VSAAAGDRRPPPQKNSVSVGIRPDFRFGSIGCTFRNAPSTQRGDACIRSSRAPAAFFPNAVFIDAGKLRRASRAHGWRDRLLRRIY